jgi:excinuclease ABC subunit C
MNERLMNIREKVSKLPHKPGIYRFMDARGNVIYVGKARDLNKRVSSYFQKGRPHDRRIELMIEDIYDLKVTRTSSEAEALIFEAGVIKDLRPKYNVELKDDKSYPYLKLTVNEKFPRLLLTRRRINDGAVYYGPYVNAGLLKKALSFMKKVFKLRNCRSLHKKVCLEYHIGQCEGPCEGYVSPEEYGRNVAQLKKFLEGKKDDLISNLQEQMKELSEKREYEKALSVKHRIEALTDVQRMHDRYRQPVFGELDELRNVLGLGKVPLVIECFDISNIGGVYSVGSMVRFTAGQAKRSDYRKFRIKSVKGIDDYSMIAEVVRRRYNRLIEENSRIPDLVLIDGGRGHLSVAVKELRELGLDDVDAASIAKERNHIYLPGRKIPVRLSPGSRVLLLIQRIRDEAHRFAINYHRKLRIKGKFDTDLRRIKGIGPSRERMLMERFGSLHSIAGATVEELISAGLDRRTAKAVHDHFRGS